MRALLLSAGEGTRLRPITNNIPKCLVPINGKPLLEYWLENLTQAGINEFLINTHYLADQVKEFVKTSKYKDNITLVYEKELLNTGGTVLANKEFFKNEPFMLVHADNLSFCDFNTFINTHNNRPKECEITMMLFKSDDPSSCGIVEIDENNIVQKFYEKVPNPPSNLANGAVYICEPSIINFMEQLDKKDIDFSLDIIPAYLGKINIFLNNIYHRDIGNPISYGLAQVEMNTHIKTPIKAVFLDRDGVINEDYGYVYKQKDFKFKKNIFALLKYYQQQGYKLFIVTNQSGIARGYYSVDDFIKLMDWVKTKFLEQNITITDIAFCPHHPDINKECNCRKPKPGMILDLASKYNIDLKSSILIGDNQSDILAAKNANIKHTILVNKETDYKVILSKYSNSSPANMIASIQ